MTKERRIEEMEEAVCDSYQPRCGCNCERCQLGEFSKIAIDNGYVSLQEFIKDLNASLRSLMANAFTTDALVYDLAVSNCIEKVEELYKRYTKNE